jgi:catechol 2,3-dioxygenase-like lactoylglutathione lyase family enzyme
MAKIKHIAIRTTDVEKTVAFYQELFDLKQVGRGLNGIYLSDAHVNLAILKYQPEKNQEPTNRRRPSGLSGGGRGWNAREA